MRVTATIDLANQQDEALYAALGDSAQTSGVDSEQLLLLKPGHK